MSTTLDGLDLEPVEHDLPELRGSSIMDRLRAEHAKIAERRTTTFPLPGYRDPELVPQFRLLGSEELKVIGGQVRRQYEDDQDKVLHALILQAVTACTGIYAREPGTAELIPLDMDGVGAVCFDERLSDFLGLGEFSRAQDVFVAVFDGNKIAAFAYAQKLSEWFQDTTVRLDEDAKLGEV